MSSKGARRPRTDRTIMTDFNPLAGAILGSAQAQQVLGTEKERQVRRAQIARKNVAASADKFEHQVESAEEIHPIDDGEQGRDPAKQNPQKHLPDQDETEPHIDVTA
jgi:hypothetical protein